MKKGLGKVPVAAAAIPVIVALVLLTGCGQQKTAGKGNAGQEERAEIYYTTWRANPDKNYPQVLIDEFQKRNPGIRVIAQTGTTTTEEYLNDQKLRFLAGNNIDVTTIRAESRRDYVNAGYLLELTGGDFLKNFTDSAIDAVRVDGKVYSAPSALNVAGVYYNKDIFTRLNLQEPANWEEFLEVSEKLKAAGITPLGNGWKDIWPVSFEIFPFLHRIVVSDPGAFERVDRGELKYTDPVFVNTFKDISDFIKKGYISKDVLGLSDDAAITLFRQQKTALLIQGEFTMISLSGDNAPGFEIGVFPIPHNRAGEENVVPITIYSSEAVAASSKYPEAALKFVEFLSSADGAKLVAENLSAFSPVIGAPMDFNPLVGLWQPLLTKKSADFYHSLQNSAAQAEMLKGVQLLFQNQITPEELGQLVQDAQDKKN
ncbi:MAG: extracellular solute-binding protein [Treponema sp.]|jgi:raffinose/stachyose/melibiose transport system substrate-binding protein|nr:extracellular solute-binding protein [Treponema sp.]